MARSEFASVLGVIVTIIGIGSALLDLAPSTRPTPTLPFDIPTFEVPESMMPIFSTPARSSSTSVRDVTTSQSENTPYGRLTLYQSPITYVASTATEGRICPMSLCERVQTIKRGKDVSVEGVINGEAVKSGNPVWYLTRIGSLQMYVYSGHVKLKD